jgi:hypothetical protein
MKLNEALELIKFSYANHSKNSSASKRPMVKVLDYEYPGRPSQKTYGHRKDLLGWNIRYFSNRKYAKNAIDQIDSFARLLGAHGEEKYKRIKYFYPEAVALLRRYQRKHINNLKRRKGIFWKDTNYNELIKLNREGF